MAHDIPQPIAIIGSACRLPGNASSPSKLWGLLLKPRDLLKEVPRDRFHWESIYRPDGKHGASKTKHAYWLEESIRLFDTHFFGINPAEAETLDPQHRLLLENVYEAIEAAGLTLEGLQGTDTGVFVGMMGRGYFNNANKDLEACSGQILSTGTSRAMASNRVSYTFDFRGPSMTIDTACSSSMMAVHLAVQSLRRNESTTAFACGTNLNIEPNDWVSLTKMNMISSDGRSKMFDETADGYGRGEGVGVVCLKRLDKALQDGDHIECIIRETGTNQDGHTKGITMPSAEAQAALIRKTYHSAGLDPARIGSRPSYFEAHGTGTFVGDPLEAQAVEAAFFPPGGEYSEDELLYIGSIKTLCGHLEGSAGIAGLLRASLAVRYGYLPPNFGFQRMNPKVASYVKHLRILTAANPWPKLLAGSPRRASINSFGFGGSNVHVVVESFDNVPARRVPSNSSFTTAEPIFTPFTFSGISERALISVLESYLNYLDDQKTSVRLRDLAWTLQYKRSQFPYRLAIPAATHDDLRNKLHKAVETHSTGKGIDIVRASQSAEPHIMGVFTGQGAQWAGMARELIEQSSFAFDIIARLDDALASLPEADRPSWKIKDELAIERSRSRLAEAALSQPLTTAVQILLVDLLDIAGVKLRAVVGHSSGEIVAAYSAGIITAEDAIRTAYYRGLHSRHAGGSDGRGGAMFATSLTPEQAMDFCDATEFRGRIFLAAFNGPTSCTVSGDADAVDAALRRLESNNIFARKLNVEKAYHSPHMQPCVKPYLQSLEQCGTPTFPSLDDRPIWFSSVMPGKRMDLKRALPRSYWTDNLIMPVRLYEAISTAIFETGLPNVVLEIGPHSALEKPVREIFAHSGKHGTVYAGLLKRGAHSISAFSEAMGVLWERFGRSAVNFMKLEMTLSGGSPPVLAKDLPTYPWLHDREYWWENRFLRRRFQAVYPPNELLGEEMNLGAQHETKWRSFLQPKDVPWLLDHRLNGVAVLPGAAYVAMAVTAARRIYRKQSIVMIELHDLHFTLPLTFPDDHTSIETVLTVVNIKSTPQHGEADFVFDFCSHQRQDELMTAARGRFTVQFGEDVDRKYPESLPKQANLTTLNLDHFYGHLDERGYNYSGPFREILSLQRRKDFSSGSMSFTPSEMTFHPALLDKLFQATFAAEHYPGDSDMLDFRVPSLVRSTKVFPARCEEMIEEVNFQVSKTGSSEYSGFLSGPGDCGIALQMEGFCTAPFKMSTPDDDLKIFSEVVWRPHIRDARSLASVCVLPKHEKEPALACERVAFYYMRRLNDIISYEEECKAPPHLQSLLRFARLTVCESLLGLQPHMPKEWINDSDEDIAIIVDMYSDLINMRLIDAVGKSYPLIVRGQVSALSVLTEDDMLTELYQEGLGFYEANSSLTSVVSAISHQSPNIRILEIGAGTGSATSRILPSAAFSTYTYTDISPAFMGPAKAKFKSYADKMVFSLLDIGRDIEEQGYTPHSFDVIVASNVLHAVEDMEAALTRTRRLLCPGGFLVCLELPITRCIGSTVIMGGLPGWWCRASVGAASPALSENDWDQLLKATGFAGVDAITPFDDEYRQGYRVFASQAVDERLLALRDPLSYALHQTRESVMVIGCKTLFERGFCDAVKRLLSRSFQDVILVSDLSDVVKKTTSVPYTVLSLAEVDEPVFLNMNPEKWDALQKLLSEATDVLWVTSGCKSPATLQHAYKQMSVGLVRTVRNEYHDLRLRHLDFDDSKDITAEVVSKALLEWHMLGQWEADSQTLLPSDTELAVRHSSILAPSVVHSRAKNDRYNSQHRRITTKLRPHDVPVQLSLSTVTGQYDIHETSQRPGNDREDIVVVKMLYSTLLALKFKKVGFLFLGLGVCADGTYAVVLSETNSSILRLPRQTVYSLTCPTRPTERDLWTAAARIVAERVVSACNIAGQLLILVSDAMFLSVIRERAAQASKSAAFITSNPDFGSTDVTFLHHNTMNVQIRRAIPEQVGLFVNLSSRPEDEVMFKRVSGVLKGTFSKIKTVDAVLRSSAFRYNCTVNLPNKSGVGAEDEQYLAEVGIFRHDGYNLTGISSISPDEINKSSFIDPLTIVDWTTKTRIPVAVQPVTATAKFSANKTYIIIGTSDSAQSVCEMMVDHGAKHIVMASRKPQVLAGWVRDVSAKGARVTLKSVDITDEKSVRKMFDSIRSQQTDQGVALLPIAGIIHMGLALKDIAFSHMTFSDLRIATDVKVKGSLYLHEQLLNDKLDFFILTSSISYVAGVPGQANYNAGNAFMVGLAHYRRNIGLPASVVHLGHVTGVGYITRTAQAQGSTGLSTNYFRAQGVYPISDRDLHQIYAEAVLASPSGSDMSPEILTGFREVSPDMLSGKASWAKQPMFAHLITESTRTSAVAKPKPQLSVREKLNEELSSAKATSPGGAVKENKEHIQEIVRAALMERLGVLLQVDASEIDEKISLLDMGIDSLVASEIGSWARKELKVQIPNSMIYEGASVTDIVQFSERHMDKESFMLKPGTTITK